MSMSQEQLSFFAKYIEENTGIVYGETNFYQLVNRLEAISKTLGLENLDALWQKCKSGITGNIKQIILDAATNNETLFFRDKRVFEAIETHCIPEVIKLRPAGSPYKIWSAASSTGQEIYTIKIILAELASKGMRETFEVTATDFSDRVLDYARAGVYSQLEVQRGLPTNFLLKYFSKNPDDTWRISPELQKNIKFFQLNLLDNWPMTLGPFDIILCRNVLIYQNNENKKKVIEKILAKLNPRGFLVLGGAESMIGLSDEFDQVSASGAIFYQKKK